jgi:hypothetical protein
LLSVPLATVALAGIRVKTRGGHRGNNDFREMIEVEYRYCNDEKNVLRFMKCGFLVHKFSAVEVWLMPLLNQYEFVCSVQDPSQPQSSDQTLDYHAFKS